MTPTEEMAMREALSKYIDPKDEGKKLANKIGMMLLKAEHDAPGRGYSVLIGVAALVLSDPEITKGNALNNADDFGINVRHEVDIGFDILSANRRKVFASQYSEAAE